MFEKLAQFILARRILVSFVLAVVFFGLGGGILRLTADFNVESFFRENSQTIYQQYYEQWGRDDAGIFIVVSGPNESLLTPTHLQTISDVAKALRSTPDVDRVVALPDFVKIRPGDDSIVLEAIRDTIPQAGETSPSALRQWQESLLEDPILVPNLLSKDGQVSTILVELRGNTTDVRALGPKLNKIRDVLRTFEGTSDLRFSDSGMISLRSDFFEAILKDQKSILPVVTLLMLILMGLFFRRLHSVIIPFVAAVVPTTMIFGVMGYLGQPIDMVNNTLTTLLPAIALADAIHLLSRFHEEARKLAVPGQRLTTIQRKTAISKSLKELGAACFLTSLTTTVGFGSLYLAEMNVLRSFGLYASLGIVFSYGTVLFVLPLLLSITRGQPAPAKENEPGEGHPLISRIARFSLKHPKMVLTLTTIITLIFVFFSSKVIVNNSLTNILPYNHKVADANAIVNSKLGGIVSYEIDFQSNQELLKNPQFLQAMQKSEAWIRQNPSVRTVISPANFIAQSAHALTGVNKIPDNPGLIAQLYLLLDSHEELEQFLDFDFKRARMAIRTQDQGANIFGAFEKKLRTHLEEVYSDFPVEVELTGAAVMAYQGINNITYDLRRGLIGAFLIVALIIALEFKSIIMVFISLVANGIPLIIGYGSLGLFNWHLEPTTGLIFTVGLGIAVDDTIHLLARFFEERNHGRTLDDALTIAVAQCGKAISLTTFVLVAALGMNLTSSFAYIQAVGASGAAIILAAWLCDLYTLPALLKCCARFLPAASTPAKVPTSIQ